MSTLSGQRRGMLFRSGLSFTDGNMMIKDSFVLKLTLLRLNRYFMVIKTFRYNDVGVSTPILEGK